MTSALGALARQRGLPCDEGAERLLPRGATGLLVEAAAQRRELCGLAVGHARPVGLPAGDAPLRVHPWPVGDW